ncbi:MAG: asparagine synthase (glutamine-hydrolyzing) [Bacteroidota bacterium]
MCGIAGFAGKGNVEDGWRMIKSISYRGPDFQDVYFDNNICLAHARLTIIDLSANANQPFFTEDKSAAIIYNGEIYNYLELKKELSATGRYHFRTNSDTEVLLYLYLEHKEKLFDKINGMFAFAIYDFRSNELLIARDRMGKKPLYYGVFNNTLIFGSELKAVLQHPLVSKEINLDALNEYLTFEYIPTPHTIFKKINKLEASHYLVFKNGKVSSNEPYWKINFTENKISFPDALLKFDSLLDYATSSRLMSDVPLGVFLSGGLDSSSIAYYAQKNSTQKINTFSIGFEDASYDESDYAQAVAKHLGTNHHEQKLTSQHSLELIPEIAEKLDEPFADPSIIPTYMLSKFTRSQVTVALGGDGSDELLAGYPTFLSNYFIGLYSAVPFFIKQLIRKGADILPVSDKNVSFDFKLKQFIKGFESRKEYIHTLWLGSFSPSEKKQLFNSEIRNQLIDKTGLNSIDGYLKDIPGENTFNKVLYIYYRTYLLEDILVKVDRASMFTSLEVRAPFLDYKVVEFITSLPRNYKLKGMKGKYLLKTLMRDKLPQTIIDRPKKGFGIPLSYWLRNDLKPLCDELLSEKALSKHRLFNYTFVKELKENHYSKKANNRKLLWNLMVFQMWFNKYV